MVPEPRHVSRDEGLELDGHAGPDPLPACQVWRPAEEARVLELVFDDCFLSEKLPNLISQLL